MIKKSSFFESLGYLKLWKLSESNNLHVTWFKFKVNQLINRFKLVWLKFKVKNELVNQTNLTNLINMLLRYFKI